MIGIVALVVNLVGGRKGEDIAVCIAIILMIPAYWFLWAQSAKRCHDLGHNGWWQLIPFYIFWLIFADSQIGDNEYGQYPK